MQPRVTVALATVWLTVAVLVGGAVTLRFSHDQYSPASPRRHAGVQRDHARDWKDHESAEDQPLDLWIGSRRSLSTEESGALARNAKFIERDFPLEDFLKDIVSSKRIYPFPDWQRQSPNIAGVEFVADKVDYGYEMPETLSRKVVVSPSDLLDDPFVADDTFQDQGPGSMEIYKLDLSKEKTLLTATTPSTNLLSKNKSKAPKKTGHLNSKTKTIEIKSTMTSANINHRQSNFFEEQRTETPLVNRDAFGVGGVPELQVGCEGLEASSSSSHKMKRSIDTPDKEKGEVPASVLLDVSPVSLDLGDVLSYEEEYEEMDELLKLKRLETTTKKNKLNRGDMDASYLNSDHLGEFRQSEKLPVRGDLGSQMNSSKFITGQKESPKRSLTDLEIKKYKETKPKREAVSLDDDDDARRSHGRRLLWFAEKNTEGFADGKSERKRRSIDWGFGEDEGVVSSDELQTVNERRRQHEMRYYQDTSRRRDQHHELNTDINRRQEYEKLLEQKQREEEYLRRIQQANQEMSNRWNKKKKEEEEEEKKRRDEMRRRQYEEYRKRTDNISSPRIDNEETRRQMEERQRQEATHNRMQEMARRNEEELRRRQEEERRRRLQEEMRKSQSKWQEENLKKSDSETSINNEERNRRLHDEEVRRREEERRKQLQEKEARRQEQYRSQQEAQRKKEEEERRHQDSMRNFSEDDRRRLEDRRREWSEKKKKQEDEEERRRQQPPSNLMRMGHPVNHPNDIRQREQDEKRRQQEESLREQKLREYIARNQPINVNRRSEEERRRYRPEEPRDSRMNVSRNDEEYRRRVEEQRKRQEEERKLQDYIRRNQPVNVLSKDNQSTAADRNWFEERRLIEEARHRDRYPDPGMRRDHGPSAPTYIDPRSSPEEVRRRQQETARRLEEERQRYEAEERRKELSKQQWKEEEERRLQMRKEAARREEEVRRAQSKRYEEDRKRLEVARIQERRRQEMLKQRSRNEVGRTKQLETKRPIYYQNPHPLAEHRRRQDSRPIPSNLMRTEETRRAAAERERQRLEAERRQQEESRMREHRQKETDQWRRQELARLNSLPVSARIIVRPGSSPDSPVISRAGFDNKIDFTGINPHREGVQVAQFPVPPTPRPPAKTPSPCVWAVVHCCSSNNNRLVKCFESLGCPGTNWDPNPCRGSIAEAARAEILKFYANA